MSDLAKTCRIDTGPSEPMTTGDWLEVLTVLGVYAVIWTYVSYRTASTMVSRTKEKYRSIWDIEKGVPVEHEPKHDMEDVVMYNVLMGLFWPVTVPGYLVARATERLFDRKKV